MKKLVLIIGALCAGVASFAQDSLAMKYAATITPEELSEHLYILASDKFQGRETGEEGQKMAADFIANYYAGLGVQPVVEGSYFQEFPLRSERTVNASMKVGDETMAFSEDFYFFPGFDASQIEALTVRSERNGNS